MRRRAALLGCAGLLAHSAHAAPKRGSLAEDGLTDRIRELHASQLPYEPKQPGSCSWFRRSFR
jgi:hypothetical protein